MKYLDKTINHTYLQESQYHNIIHKHTYYIKLFNTKINNEIKYCKVYFIDDILEVEILSYCKNKRDIQNVTFLSKPYCNTYNVKNKKIVLKDNYESVEELKKCLKSFLILK